MRIISGRSIASISGTRAWVFQEKANGSMLALFCCCENSHGLAEAQPRGSACFALSMKTPPMKLLVQGQLTTL